MTLDEVNEARTRLLRTLPRLTGEAKAERLETIRSLDRSHALECEMGCDECTRNDEPDWPVEED